MSYIQLFKVEAVPGPEIDGDTIVSMGTRQEKVMDRDLDNEILSFVADLITAVDDLDEDTVIIIRKVIY